MFRGLDNMKCFCNPSLTNHLVIEHSLHQKLSFAFNQQIYFTKVNTFSIRYRKLYVKVIFTVVMGVLCEQEYVKVVLDIFSKIKKISASLVLELRCSGEKSLKLCLKSLDVYSS